MTDINDDSVYEVDYGAPPQSAMGRMKGLLSTFSGAALAVGLIAGVVWWLTDLGKREAESLPVFHSTVAKPRVQPADPGGAVTPYRDISSYGAGGGLTGAAGGSGLAPAPARPEDGDLAMAALSPSAQQSTAESTTEETPAEPEAAALDPAPSVPVPSRRPPNLVAREEVATATRPIDQAALAPAAETAATPETADQGPQPSAFDDGGNVAADTAAEAPREQQAVDQAAQLATRAALSPIQIQLGAYTDRGFTESEWQRIASGNRDVLQGRALAIQSTVSGGARYYRLRVGPFDDRAEATRVCEQLKARGQDCIVASNG